MNYFLDSSALVKLYHPEPGSSIVEAVFRETNRRIFISRLTAVELQSALSLKIRTGRLVADDMALLRTRFLNDVATDAIVVIAISELHYTIAESLLMKYGGRIGLRTLDALQLAVALEMHRLVGLDGFMVADQTLAEVAKDQGIAVMNL